MRQNPENPLSNRLPKGLEETSFIEAIEGSGYPLQGIVSEKLQDQFHVTEEWGYIDDETKEHRSLDLFAYRKLSENSKSPVQTSLVLLIECKKSFHPYVFFQDVTTRQIPRFPPVVGVPRGHVPIHDKSGHRMSEIHPSRAIGLDKHPFVELGPPKCAAFSKAVPKGKKVELFGSDPFNSVILPLVKALRHASCIYKLHEQKPKQIFPVLILCLSVMDAPMVLVESPRAASEPVLSPWVRVVRQEANPKDRDYLPFRYYAVDVLHVDSLDAVLVKHILPFAQEFDSRACQLGEVLFHGGQVAALDNWTWDQIEKKVPPR